MIPANIVLLESSGENNGAYMETSQIDEETNLKLRTSPTLPLGFVTALTHNGLGYAKKEKHMNIPSSKEVYKLSNKLRGCPF